nr:MAG TPA: hypothetical protein [Caudoviricetes sp.]
MEGFVKSSKGGNIHGFIYVDFIIVYDNRYYSDIIQRR